MSEFTDEQIAAEEDKALNADVERFWYEFYYGTDEDRCRFHEHASPLCRSGLSLTHPDHQPNATGGHAPCGFGG